MPEVPFLAGDGNYACMRLMNTAAKSATDFRNCYTSDYEGQEVVCSEGLLWSYSACWFTPNLALEQQVGDQWVLVSARISMSKADSADVCTDTDTPHLVAFTLTEPLKRSQVTYRIRPTAPELVDPFIESLTVRVTRTPS